MARQIKSKIADLDRRSLLGTTRTASPTHKPSHPPLWKSPLALLGSITTLAVIAAPIYQNSQTTTIISAYLRDASASGLHDRANSETICKARADLLKPGDRAIDLDFADRSETTRWQQIDGSSDLSQTCQSVKHSSNIGLRNGTSPLEPMKRLLNAITAERSHGNQQPIAAVMLLENAEPIPGEPSYDYNQFQQQIEQLAKHRGKIAIVGSTGKLGEILEQKFSNNPSVYLCPTSATVECVRRVFDAARAPLNK